MAVKLFPRAAWRSGGKTAKRYDASNSNDKDVLFLSPFDRVVPHSSVCIIHAEIHGKSYFVLEVFSAEFVGGDCGGSMTVIASEIGYTRDVGEGRAGPWTQQCEM